MFQDSVPAGSYNDPFLSSVCVSLQKCLAFYSFDYFQLDRHNANRMSMVCC